MFAFHTAKTNIRNHLPIFKLSTRVISVNGLEEFQASLAQALAELRKLDLRRRKLVTEIQDLREKVQARAFSTAEKSGAYATAAVTHYSPGDAKLRLFRSLFRGREDVYPKRFESKRTGKSGYQPHCRNEWVRGVCEKPRLKCKDCPNREFIPVTNLTIRNHLLRTEPDSRRDFTTGVYPLLPNDGCWFLAADFDKASWKPDVLAFISTCRQFNVPVAVERSRSGNGGHAWIFFDETIPARLARQLAQVSQLGL